ncbi:recombinase family protein [Kamptonema animale CS-326]|jgi:DNA invertase Pin-like site-specific DNA recombinase|nr:recombinase family protein [Kamptonema animale]MDB9511228.1 recombinase family protein [Kamptonema animale CS-326]
MPQTGTLRAPWRHESMLVGYARISTLEQNLDLQRDALLSAGCEKVFTDIASGIQDNREGLKETLGLPYLLC